MEFLLILLFKFIFQIFLLNKQGLKECYLIGQDKTVNCNILECCWTHKPFPFRIVIKILHLTISKDHKQFFKLEFPLTLSVPHPPQESGGWVGGDGESDGDKGTYFADGLDSLQTHVRQQVGLDAP